MRALASHLLRACVSSGSTGLQADVLGGHSWDNRSQPHAVSQGRCLPEGAFGCFLFLNLDPVFVCYQLFLELTLAPHLFPYTPANSFQLLPCPPGSRCDMVAIPQSTRLSSSARHRISLSDSGVGPWRKFWS